MIFFTFHIPFFESRPVQLRILPYSYTTIGQNGVVYKLGACAVTLKL